MNNLRGMTIVITGASSGPERCGCGIGRDCQRITPGSVVEALPAPAGVRTRERKELR